ncbi:hypothetical protein KP509_1Z148100 [Ceratopteris richardii]|nr:hypothetical protein KP509_1Z148100 [Ceratopteris richardii]
MVLLWKLTVNSVLSCDDKGLPSVDRLLSLAQSAVMKHGIRGLVVDPHNELDHCDYSQPTEIEYMTKMLTRLRSFAQHNACHVWFITHPRQLQVWLGGPPHVSDVSGSVHFITKCDNCIVIHCSRDPCRDALDKVEIVMKKTPNKASRLHGSAVLYFNRFTGLYSDVAREKPR